MPWNWNSSSQMIGAESADRGNGLGGTRGSKSELDSTSAWPHYNLEYLARKLNEPRAAEVAKTNKYGAANEMLNDHNKQIYLEQATKTLTQDANEQLKREFVHWLQGQHSDNHEPSEYVNKEGKPKRMQVFRRGFESTGGGNADIDPGSQKDNWKPTWWGKSTLLHLPGVREFLSQQHVDSHWHSYDANLLAEYGPQNLQQAWYYFKHWVKGRPLTDGGTVDKTFVPGFDQDQPPRPRGGELPDHLMHTRKYQNDAMPLPLRPDSPLWDDTDDTVGSRPPPLEETPQIGDETAGFRERLQLDNVNWNPDAVPTGDVTGDVSEDPPLNVPMGNSVDELYTVTDERGQVVPGNSQTDLELAERMEGLSVADRARIYNEKIRGNLQRAGLQLSSNDEPDDWSDDEPSTLVKTTPDTQPAQSVLQSINDGFESVNLLGLPNPLSMLMSVQNAVIKGATRVSASASRPALTMGDQIITVSNVYDMHIKAMNGKTNEEEAKQLKNALATILGITRAGQPINHAVYATFTAKKFPTKADFEKRAAARLKTRQAYAVDINTLNFVPYKESSTL